MENLGIRGGNQRGRGGWGNGNAGRGVMQPSKEVAHQEDRAQFYVFLGKTEFEGVMQWSQELLLSVPRWLLFCLFWVLLIQIPGRERLEWERVYKPKLVKIISSIRARKLVGQGCLDYLAHVWDVEAESPSIESIHVVSEFKEVFPTDLPGMPSDRDIDFYVDLETSTHPISIPLYRMAPSELRELKAQNEELRDKGFILPSAFP
ncbi:hypothetical protein KY284_029941 [Solanum tuberosum]|nr:hypothetical protein KY284_029941 [Solanum tuberosum]